MEVDVAVRRLCLEVGRCFFCQPYLLQLLQYYVPTDPNLNRGCSAGSASPRRNSGVAGRWKLRVGRAAERSAREAARGKNKDILQVVVVEVRINNGFSNALLQPRLQCELFRDVVIPVPSRNANLGRGSCGQLCLFNTPWQTRVHDRDLNKAVLPIHALVS